MFVSAIERVSAFTRPVNSIVRTYGGKQIIPGAGTLFFVNEEGYAVTCRHIAEILISSEQINQGFAKFSEEKAAIRQDNKQKTALKGLELKYKYQPDSVIQIKHNFVDCVDQMSGYQIHVHPEYDLAIIQFQGFQKIHYRDCARFIKDLSGLKQGKFLCRLGYAFPEFSNYAFNEQANDIQWTNSGVMHSPQFPLEGMITRHLADGKQVFGIELSTPGLRGQSGGPLFDAKGTVYGMQFSTKHMHLGFDLVDKDILVNNQVKKVSDYSFLHLGQCIHAEVIKAFLREHNVRYYEE